MNALSLEMIAYKYGHVSSMRTKVCSIEHTELIQINTKHITCQFLVENLGQDWLQKVRHQR